MSRQSKYKPQFCENLIEHMRAGYSFEACCGLLGVARSTAYDWAEKHVEFAEAKEIGEALGQSFWEQKAIQNLVTYEGAKFNSTVWAMTMKNRFGYRDKHELTGGNGGPLQFTDMTEKQVDEKIGELTKRLSASK